MALARSAAAAAAGAALAMATGGIIVAMAPRDPGRAGPQVPTLVVKRSGSSYAVSGDTVGEIGTSLARGPRGFWGMTRHKISWKAKFRESAGGCVATEGRVLLEVKVTLPRLKAPGAPGTCAADSFLAMLGSLSRHEEGHVDIATSGAETLTRELGLMISGDSCGALRAAWEAKARSATSAIDRANTSYDARTAHGRSEGVTLAPCPVTITEPAR